jgi:hypothetical protein
VSRIAARQWERADMESRVDGLVLCRLVENEAYLQARTLLMKIGDTGYLEVTADTLSQDVFP